MEQNELVNMQRAYRSAVEGWITAIRTEEDLASIHPTLSQVDRWEEAHDKEEEARTKAAKAKLNYEDAVRKHFFHF